MTVISSQGVFYDAANHTYTTLTNERLVSNTEILEGLGFCDYSRIPDDKRIISLEIGKDVHKATALLDRGQKRKDKLTHVAGYVEAWQKFKREFKFHPSLIEEPLYDPAYLVATTPDRHGSSIHSDSTTVQIKSGEVEDYVGLQLAFEERCILIAKGRKIVTHSSPNRFGVWLRPDGTYKPRRFADPMDIRVFLGAASSYQWLRNHGRLPKVAGNSRA